MTHPAIEHRWAVVPYTRGNGVEVGGAPAALFPHFKPVADSQGIAAASLDFVFVVGAIDAREQGQFYECIKQGGYMVQAVADQLYVEQIGLTAMFTVPQEFPHPCACVVRYGGFGDSIQAANILPALKRAGYHVVMMTLPRGKDILEHDPHIDQWLLQDDDQVPNHELANFWAHWAPKFDKFVQLSESVEGTLLAYPGRANHAWPDAVRRKHLGRNYLEWTSELAELPYASEAVFYESPAEKVEARETITKLRFKAAGMDGSQPMGVRLPPAFVVMWTLSGSTHHKSYPHQDDVIANALAAMPEALFILSGDDACRILEAGWEDHPRILCTSGELSIRQTLALAKACDCVVGPETGVLNAVAFESMGKVIMLSHSSIENLTKHWVNTVTLTAETPCYPCHRLHYGREFCPEHEPTGAAMCQWDIPPQAAWSAIAGHYSEWKERGTVFTPRVPEEAAA